MADSEPQNHASKAADPAATSSNSNAFQVHGALGASAATATPPKIRRRNRMINSCLECRRRKLKCNKAHPCGNCQKFGRDCLFLAPALDAAGQLKLTEIKEKMGSLERVLERDVVKYTVRGGPLDGDDDGYDNAPPQEDEKDLEPTPLAVADAAYDDDADDDMLDLGIQLGKMRITDRIGGFYRPHLSAEIDFQLSNKGAAQPRGEIDLGSPESGNSTSPRAPFPTPAYLLPGPTYIAPSSSFFFGSSAGQASLIDFLPSKSAADRLLKAYFEAVHPIARLVHRPSFERVYQGFWDDVSLGIEPPHSAQAVVFAAMFSGVVSMSEDAILRDFGVGKASLVDNFKLGTETALSRANFLRSTKIETMQSFLMYMIPMCRDQISRAHSGLTGTAIRLAECMGLHRDGTTYGLTPIEIHVRRLIWYQLCFLDLRTCEAQGPRPSIHKEEFDTRFPLNVNDVDFLSSKPPTEDKDEWTDMTMSLIRFELVEIHRQIWRDRIRLEKNEISITAVLGKVERFKKYLNDKYDHLLNEDIPVQRAAKLIKEIMVKRMHIMVLHRYYHSPTAIPDRLRQLILISGTAILEGAIALEQEPALSTWKWYSGAIQQYHVALILLLEVFKYPYRKETDRIWACLDYIFDVPAALPRNEKAKMVLGELRDKSAIFRDVRKMRAPTTMVSKLKKPYWKENDMGTKYQAEFANHIAESKDITVDTSPMATFPPPRRLPNLGQEFDFQGINNVEAVFTAPQGQMDPFYHPNAHNMGAPPDGAQNYHPAPPQVPSQRPGGFVSNPTQDFTTSAGQGDMYPSSGRNSINESPAQFGPSATTSAMPPIIPIQDMMLDIDWNEWDKLFPPEDLNMPMPHVSM